MPSSKLSRILVACTLLVTLGGCGTEGEPETANIESFLDKVAEFRDLAQYRSAIIEARRAIQAAPEDSRGYVALADVFIELGQPREAIAVLENGEISGQDPALLVSLGRAYLNSGKVRSARDLMDEHGDAMQSALPNEAGLLLAELTLAEGNLDRARQAYEQLNNAPGDIAVKARLGLARIEGAYENYQDALDLIEAVIESNPDNADALLLASQIKIAQDDLEGAEDYLVEAVSKLKTSDIMTPRRHAVLSLLRDVLTQQGRTSEALIYSGLIAESMPDTVEINEKLQAAIDAMSSGDFDAARELLQEIQEQAPGSQQAGTLLGALEFLAGNNDKAAEYFDQFVDPEVATPATLQMFALAELRLNQPLKVIESLSADIDDSSDPRIVSLYGIAQASAGNNAEAEKYLAKAVSLAPSDPRLRIPLARLQNLEGRPEDALEQVKAAYELSPDVVILQTAMLQQLVAMGRTDDANELAETLRKDHPDSEDTLVLVAEFYTSQQAFDKARDILTNDVDEGSFRRVLLLGRLALAGQEWATAEAWFRQAVELEPEDQSAYKGLISAAELMDRVDPVIEEVDGMEGTAPTLVLTEYFARNERFDEARSKLATLDEGAPQRQQYARLINLSEAQSARNGGDLERARALLLEELNASPESGDILATLVDLEIRAENFKEAESLLSRLESLEQGAIRNSLLRGDLAIRQSDPATAATHYTRVWQEAPSDQSALKLYQATRARGDVPAAEMTAFFDEWNEKAPDSVLRQLTVAGHHMENQDNATARTAYEALLDQNPDVAVAHNNLAWIYGEDEIDRAVEAGARAFELAPNSGQIADTYGWFLYLRGDTERAREVLAKALELAPDDEEISAHYQTVMENGGQ